MPSRESVDSTLPCSEAQLWLSLKVDGEEVPPEVSGRLEEHLEACRSCAEWLREETGRASELRSYLQLSLDEQQDFEEALIDAARDAGWDERALRFRRRGVGRILRQPSWRNSLILIAAASLFLAVAGFATMDWLFPPSDEQVASRTTRLDVAPSLLPPLAEDVEGQVVSDADGQLVEIRLERYRYQVIPSAVDGAAEEGDPGARPAPERSELPVELELERVESTPVRLASWPYQ